MQKLLSGYNVTRESRLRFGLGALAIAIAVATGLAIVSFAGGSIG
jgi:hypothetical protein